ncbi:MAG: PQQ-binding-like beta-propeller repeat protein [Phycisphaerae bacterium]
MRHGGDRRSRQRNGYATVLMAAFVAACVGIRPITAAPPKIPDFSFIQISDIHIDPHPAGTRTPGGGRSVDTVRWICAEAAKPQPLPPYNITAPPPAFVIATGDLTEYGVIGETWSDIEQYFRPLPVPFFITPGNHDNTWTAILPIMRKRHGGDSYSFDRFGCHFAVLNSAAPQEPVPCLDRRTLNWLRTDLDKLTRDTPVFLFMHHPLYTTEFAYPYEQLRLLDAIEGHRIAVILDGHGHHPTPGKWENIDRVMGGSTFGENAGYNIVSVVSGVLRVTYRFHADKPMKANLEKPLFGPEPTCDIEIASPAPEKPITSANQVAVVVRVRANGVRVTRAVFDVDGLEKSGGELKPAGDRFRAILNVKPLLPGRHFLRVSVTDDAKRTWDRAAAFEIALPESGSSEWAADRHAHDAGMKAAPLPCHGLLIAVDTGGRVTAFDRSFRKRWTFETGGEILATPAVAGDIILFGSGDGQVYGLSAPSGRKLWAYKAAAPVYGQPIVKDSAAYFGDNEGYVHAISVRDGRKLWAVKHAEFSIEAAGTICDDTFCVGAWDGWVYAVNLADGTLKWKQRGPTGQGGQPSRYFAPADCPPVFAGGKLFITDRGYNLGLYGSDGKYLGLLQKNCAAVGPSEDGRFVYARTLGDGLTKYDAEGKVVWKQDVPLGRFPIQPTERGGKVYICSNRGLLSILDAKDGKIVWQYQVSGQLHVMAGVAVDERGVAYTADMDGGLTAVGPRAALAAK